MPNKKEWKVIIRIEDDGIPIPLSQSNIERLFSDGTDTPAGIKLEVVSCEEVPRGD
jgi:hypothetical protein